MQKEKCAGGKIKKKKKRCQTVRFVLQNFKNSHNEKYFNGQLQI